MTGLSVDIPWSVAPWLPQVPEERPESMYLPYVPITVRGPASGQQAPRASVELAALFDTGADFTYLPAGLIKPLGLNGPPLEKGEAEFPMKGPDPFSVQVHEVEICLADHWRARVPVRFIDWQDPTPILGREPWFRRLRITLDGPARVTTIGD